MTWAIFHLPSHAGWLVDGYHVVIAGKLAERGGIGLQVYKIFFLLPQLENSYILSRKSLSNLKTSELWLGFLQLS